MIPISSIAAVRRAIYATRVSSIEMGIERGELVSDGLESTLEFRSKSLREFRTLRAIPRFTKELGLIVSLGSHAQRACRDLEVLKPNSNREITVKFPLVASNLLSSLCTKEVRQKKSKHFWENSGRVSPRRFDSKDICGRRGPNQRMKQAIGTRKFARMRQADKWAPIDEETTKSDGTKFGDQLQVPKKQYQARVVVKEGPVRCD